MMMSETRKNNGEVYRILAYWIVVFAVSWVMAFYFMWTAEKHFDKYNEKTHNMLILFKDNENVQDWATNILGFMVPILLASCFATLLVTNSALPSSKISWINKFFAAIRFVYDRFIGWLRSFVFKDAEYGVALYGNKKNQFGIGQTNFNIFAFWFTVVPAAVLFFVSLHSALERAEAAAAKSGKPVSLIKIQNIAHAAAWVGVVILAFFLIPVSRHSILLAAVNWSPIHALRIHIWAGYTSFTFITLHGLLLVTSWFMYTEGPIYRQFIPYMYCFNGWNGNKDYASTCRIQIYNMTGLIAYFFFTILWATSINWFRRKYYHLFYIFHVSFGFLSLIASIWHFEYIGLYLLPSLLYYLASTMPTMIQALSSKFRGGVKIKNVVAIKDAGDCFEFHIQINGSCQTSLNDDHPSKFIKLCIPELSVVWHPFTVFTHPEDPGTLRMMIRPVGSYTKKMRSVLLSKNKKRYPLTLVDGLYKGGDHCQEALSHDHVTMIAGGIAITPFLSMLHSLLRVLVKYNADSTARTELKSITLIWTCREYGLFSYVKKNYFEHMTKMISSLDIDFVFKIKIFHTTSKHSAVIDKIIDESTFHCDEEDPSEIKEQEVSDDSMSNSSITKKKITTGHDISDDSMTNLSITKKNNATGHDMELGNMMPGRSLTLIENIPFFVLYTMMIWIGFHFMFNKYDDRSKTFASMSEQTWYTLLLIVFYITVGLVLEGSIFLYRRDDNNHTNRSNSENNDDNSNEIEVGLDKYDYEKHKNEDYDVLIMEDEDISSYFTIEQRRPNADDCFVDASASNSPGIFVCGPAAMTAMVYQRARQENSFFGLTRYALYEESFEM